MRELVSEMRALCAGRPCATRDMALSELLCFNSRVELERSGAWDYLVHHLEREGGGHMWNASSWYDVRRGRPFGRARSGRLDLSGERWIKGHVLDEVIARTWREPVYALDLSGLGAYLSGIAMELLARADLSSLVWLDLSWGVCDDALWHLVTRGDVMPALKSLEMRGGGQAPPLDRLGALTSSLVHLGLSQCQLDVSWLDQNIRPEVVPALRSLDLSRTPLTHGVWEVFGERHGFEAMYALRLQGSMLGVKELECMRWLPCARMLDTFGLDILPECPVSQRASEAILEMFSEDCISAYDLGVSVAALGEHEKVEALGTIASSRCYRNLCALELDGVSWSEEAFDALQVSMMDDGSARLCELAIRAAELDGDCEWSIWTEKERIEQRLCTWSRLAQLEVLALHVSSPTTDDLVWETDVYHAWSVFVERECAWVQMLSGCSRSMRSLTLEGLSAIALASFWRGWSRGDRLDLLERLELRCVEFNPIYFQQDISDGCCAAPGRVVFSGDQPELEAAYLATLHAARPHTPLARWFDRMQVEALEHEALLAEQGE